MQPKLNFTPMKTGINKKVSITSLIFIIAAVLNVNAQVKYDITAMGTQFSPSALTINVGDTVVWTNVSGFHSINGSQSSYPSNPESFGIAAGTGWTYSYMFNTPGIYDYHCDPHVSLGMTGKITVVEIPGITVNFSGMTPHVDQNLWLAVIDKDSGEEVTRIKKQVEESFSINIPELETGKSYSIDFFADFNEDGGYNAPPVDHAWRIEIEDLEGDSTISFTHNTSFTDIMWQHKLTVNFSSMNPHVGQNLWLAVTDQVSGEEIIRIKKQVEESFSIEVPGIIPDSSYFIDFFADFNENGMYDAPPTDHAWRIELDNVVGDSTINFTHNTNFTNINWKHKLTINFSSMNPHVGQDLWLALIDKSSGKEITRIKRQIEETFSIELDSVADEKAYTIDFFADFNEDGGYDAPPTDHAWRIEIDELENNGVINFVHNTSFTDIHWQHKITLNLSAMDPHVSQDLWLALINKSSDKELKRIKEKIKQSFSIEISGVVPDSSYSLDFFADYNEDGRYDGQDHPWRIEIDNLKGDTVIDFVHNTNFTDIMWQHKLTINFSSMNPHIGQNLYLSLFDKESEEKFTDAESLIDSTFSIEIFGIIPDKSYEIDFYADFNENGIYDAPPTDHAWRLSLDSVMGDTTIGFVHNTNFTDITRTHTLTVQFSGMTPHVGQALTLYLYNTISTTYVDTITLDSISESFELSSTHIIKGSSYNIDFYADFNENGMYDAPPADHAWRIILENIEGDTTIAFTHNTNFTDIFEEPEPTPTDIAQQNTETLKIYPNPANSFITLSDNNLPNSVLTVNILDVNGKIVKSVTANNTKLLNGIDVHELQSGIYFIEVKANKYQRYSKLIINR